MPPTHKPSNFVPDAFGGDLPLELSGMREEHFSVMMWSSTVRAASTATHDAAPCGPDSVLEDVDRRSQTEEPRAIPLRPRAFNFRRPCVIGMCSLPSSASSDFPHGAQWELVSKLPASARRAAGSDAVTTFMSRCSNVSVQLKEVLCICPATAKSAQTTRTRTGFSKDGPPRQLDINRYASHVRPPSPRLAGPVSQGRARGLQTVTLR